LISALKLATRQTSRAASMLTRAAFNDVTTSAALIGARDSQTSIAVPIAI
jgi:hypothetical protein